MWYNVTKEAHDALRKHARSDFVETARPAKDGTILIELSQHNWEHLLAAAIGEESPSDTIIRLCAGSHKH